ncbi:hypothetical protein [uncultured Arcobacter sp.]|uniref:hypothetical protein n=1 Tax=uncultured Arcobacter sp. TaxID=165434 RepID=UPI002622443E|nr:hypothetical protein [uncultured Arcobacter sp.]
MKIIFILIFTISSIFAISPKDLLGTWEMSNLSEKRANISFGLYNSYNEPFDIKFMENYIVKYHGEEHKSYYVLDADKIFVSKHKPFNGEFLNSKAIDIYEIVKKLNKKDTNKKECYEIHILQKALYGIYSRRGNQKMCR